MIDAVVGAVIMVVASTSLFFAVEVVEGAIRESGRYPIKKHEFDLLSHLKTSLQVLNPEADLESNVEQLIEDPEQFKGQVLDLLPIDFQGLDSNAK